MSDPKNDNSPSAQLEKLLGFNPTREPGMNRSALDEVVAELAKERGEKAKVKAREFLSKAIDLATKRTKLERETKKQFEAFDKELGKLMNQLRAALDGRPAPVEGEQTETPAAE